VLWLSAGHYKFGDINNNELLIINLAAVRADGNANISSSPSPVVGCHCKTAHHKKLKKQKKKKK